MKTTMIRLFAVLLCAESLTAQQEIYVQLLQSAVPLKGAVTRSAYVPGLAALTSSEKELVVVDPSTLTIRFSYPQLPAPLASLFFDSAGRLITARVDGQVNMWDLDKGLMTASFTAHGKGILDALSGDKAGIVLAGNDRVVKVFDPVEGSEVASVSTDPDEISALAIHPNRRIVAVAMKANKVVVFDSALTAKATLTDPRETPSAAAFSSDGAVFATGGTDGTVRWWDTGTWKYVGSGSAQRGLIRSLAFDPSGRWMASTSTDSTLVVYDVRTMSPVKTLRRDGSAFTNVFFDGPDAMISGSSNGTVDRWQVLERPPDTTAPTLTILRPARYTAEAPSRMYAASYEILGIVYDENEVVDVTVGGVKAKLTDPAVGNVSASQAGLRAKEFNATVPLATVGVNKLEVRATDAAGNSSVQPLHIQRLSQAEAVEILAPAEGSETDHVAVELQIKPWFDVASYSISANTIEFVNERGPLRIRAGDVIREEIPLIVGYNQIGVTITQKGGERFSKILGVTRKFSAAITETVRRPDPAARGTGPQRWAVIVGVSEYANRGIPALRYADRDAEALASFLQTPEGGGFDADHMRVLINKDATLSNLRDAMIDFLQQAIDKDLVVIYFAGHGAPDPTRPQNLYLLTYDTDPSRLGTTAFPMWDIQTVVSRQIAAKKVVVLSDACHSGGISVDVATRGLDVTQSNPINQYLAELARAKDGMVVFTASAAGEVSQEFPELGHGVFTYYLLEGLKGAADTNNDLLVTVNEVMGYVEEQVKRKTRGAQNPTRSQTTYDKELPMSVLNK